LQLRGSLEGWAGAIPAPEQFDGVDAVADARELGMFLRFMFRDPSRRSAYIKDLERTGKLPFVLEPADARGARDGLREFGRPASEIARLIAER